MTLGKTFAEKQLEQKGKDYDYDVAKLRRRIAELEAENKRLREALERAAGAIQAMHVGHSHTGENGEAVLARAALKEGKG